MGRHHAATALLVSLLSALLLVPPAAAGAAPPTGSSGDPGPRLVGRSVTELERRVVALTNQRRLTHGCPRLRIHAALVRSAGRHSARMAGANQLDHRLPGEPPLETRVERAGYRGWTMLAENIAQGQRTPRAVVRAWMNSPGHRRNILTCRFRHIGVGLVYGHGSPWWTQNFGRR